MAERRPAVEALRAAIPTPIAQLNPEAQGAEPPAVDAIVTITWPFSVVTGSIAFVLAAHDPLLRRDRGQLRVECHGPAGRALADSGVGAGDEVRLSLDGAEWESVLSGTRLPAGALDRQLKFTNRLLLSIRGADSEGPHHVDIDAPAQEQPQSQSDNTPKRQHTPVSPEPQQPPFYATPTNRPATLPAKRPASLALDPEEFASPAFLKRARVSYGSLFEEGFDLFAEANNGKPQRKPKSRFSMGNTTWKYCSRSPSPQAEEPAGQDNGLGDESAEGQSNDESSSAKGAPAPQPSMVDQGSQTRELSFDSPVNVQISAEPRLLQHSPTPAHLEARFDSHHDVYPTPSRTLFERSLEPSRTAGAQSVGFDAVASREHGFGFDMSLTRHVDLHTNLVFGHQSVENVTMNRAMAFGQGIPASHHTTATFGTHNIDPDLHPDDSGSSHLYPHVPPSGDIPWQDGPVPSHFASQPAPDASPHAVMDVKSPSSPRGSSFMENETPGKSSVPDGQRTASLDRDRSMGDSALEAQNSRAPSRDDNPPAYQDGGDLEGEDYDLRNYDRTRDDDESISESELPRSDGSDPSKAAIDFSDEEQDDDAEEEEDGMDEEDEIDGEAPDQVSEPFINDDDGYEDDYYDDEDEEAEEEDDYYEEPRLPLAGLRAAPAGPVFISLLSDSEDDEAPAARAAAAPDTTSTQPSRPKQEGDERWHSPIAPSDRPSEESAGDYNLPTSQINAQPDDVDMQSSEDDDTSFESQPRRQSESMEVEKYASHPEGSGLEQAPQTETNQREDATEVECKAQDRTSARPLTSQYPPGAIGNVDVAESEGAAQQAVSAMMQRPNSQGKEATEADDVWAQQSVPGAMRLIDTKDEAAKADGEAQPRPTSEEAVQMAENEVAGSKSSQAVQVAENEVAGSNSSQAVQMAENEVAGSKSSQAVQVAENEVAGSNSSQAVQIADNEVVGSSSSPQTAHTHSMVDMDAADAGRTGQMDTTTRPPAEPTGDVAAKGPYAFHAKDNAGETVAETATEEVLDTQVSWPPADGDAGVDEETMATLGGAVSPEASGQTPSPRESRGIDERDTTPLHKEQPGQEEEDYLAAEAQIMNEFHEYQSPRALVDDAGDLQGDGWADEDEPLITVRSLRSHSHRKTVSADTTSRMYEDPSLCLATARSREASHEDAKAPALRRMSRNKSEQPALGNEGEMAEARAAKESTWLATARRPRRHTNQQAEASPPGDRQLGFDVMLRASRPNKDGPDASLQLSREAIGEGGGVEDDDVAATLRVTRSMAEQTDLGSQLAKASPSSIKSTRGPAAPEMSRRRGRGATPETSAPEPAPTSVAESAAAESEDAAALKRELQRTLRVSLPDCLPLRGLRSSLNRTTDILAVSASTPPQPHRPKHGPRDYMLELVLTDPSVAPSSVVVAHVFRPYLASLPVVQAGDVLLLRRMQVVSIQGRGFGVRTTGASAWAVFEKGDGETLPQIKGPPIEVTDDEVDYARRLRRWWAVVEEKTLSRTERVTQRASMPQA